MKNYTKRDEEIKDNLISGLQKMGLDQEIINSIEKEFDKSVKNSPSDLDAFNRALEERLKPINEAIQSAKSSAEENKAALNQFKEDEKKRNGRSRDVENKLAEKLKADKNSEVIVSELKTSTEAKLSEFSETINGSLEKNKTDISDIRKDLSNLKTSGEEQVSQLVMRLEALEKAQAESALSVDGRLTQHEETITRQFNGLVFRVSKTINGAIGKGFSVMLSRLTNNIRSAKKIANFAGALENFAPKFQKDIEGVVETTRSGMNEVLTGMETRAKGIDNAVIQFHQKASSASEIIDSSASNLNATAVNLNSVVGDAAIMVRKMTTDVVSNASTLTRKGVEFVSRMADESISAINKVKRVSDEEMGEFRSTMQNSLVRFNDDYRAMYAQDLEKSRQIIELDERVGRIESNADVEIIENMMKLMESVKENLPADASQVSELKQELADLRSIVEQMNDPENNNKGGEYS